MTKQKSAKTKKPRRSPKRAEADKLTAFLNEAAIPPAATPEVLVPGAAQDWVGVKVEQLRSLAALPRAELLGKAEKALVKQARRFLKANAEYGISLSGLVRGGALFLLSFPVKRQER